MRRFVSHPEWWTLFFVLAIGLLWPNPSAAATGSDQRLALVIGNSAYQSSPLVNPVNDATDMAAALERVGFEVILQTDADQRTMERAVRQFGRKLRGGGVGLFYYAGHGLQIDGRNYLIPVDAMIESESDVRFEAVDAGRILGKMEDAANGLNIVILDACRDNPFARSFRSGQKGLAKMDAPVGSLLAYATAPGSTAADGADRNGLYTSKLLKYMHEPGMKIEDMFKQVRREVMSDSGDKQVPWESSSMAGDFYFTPKRLEPAPAKAQPKPAEPDPDMLARLAALEAEKARLEAEKKLLEDRQRLEAEKLRLEAEKKLLAEQRRMDEEKRRFEAEKAELAAMRKKADTEASKETAKAAADRKLAYAPSPGDAPGATSAYRLALFPQNLRFINEQSWSWRNAQPIIRETFGKTVEVFHERKDIRLTDTAVSKDGIYTEPWMLRDIHDAARMLGSEELKGCWHRPSIFAGVEPDLDKIVSLARRLGVDLVLIHDMVYQQWVSFTMTIYLIDIARKEVFTKKSSKNAVAQNTEALIEEFLKTHSAKQTGTG